MLAREPRAGRVHPADAFDDRPRAAPQLLPFVSRLVRGTARRGGGRLGGGAGRSGQLGLFAHPLRERRAERPGEERPGGRGHGRAAVRHAVAVRPRGEGLRGARERTARVHGRAERALADRRHLMDQAGQGLARRQARRGERQGVRGLRPAQQLPVHRARRGLVRPGTHGRPAEAERLREARDRLCQFQGRGRDPLRERHPAPQEPRRHPRPSRLVGREGREVWIREGGRADGAEVGAGPHQGGGGPTSARGHPRRVPSHGHPEDLPQRIDRGGHLRQRGDALGRAQRRVAVHALPRRSRRLHPLLELQPHQEHARPPAGAAVRLFERIPVPLLVPAARPDQGEGSRARILARDPDDV